MCPASSMPASFHPSCWAKSSTTWSRRSTWGPRWQSWKTHGRRSWLQRHREGRLRGWSPSRSSLSPLGWSYGRCHLLQPLQSQRISQEWPQPRSQALSWSPMCPQQSLAGHSSSDSPGQADDWGLPIREDGREWGPRTHAGSGRGRGRCLDRQGSAQRAAPHEGVPGGQCGWEDQASYSATPRPSSSPGMGRARRLAWEPEHGPNIVPGSQPSTTLEDQVLHHLVQEEHLGPTVAELKDPRQTQLAPETQGGPASWLEPVQELPESPGLELRPVSPASAPAEPVDVPGVAPAPEPGPELEPYVSTAESSRSLIFRFPWAG
ncbi:uncharacterized protein LOC130685075 [Manis pentadactyla]|uniref:uncharacterized protein LOC130685075 n=1 Tax=Manis pentadactyla TaxID=143292 RepID=UPI00255CD805|nr:uncharacterized protein LOC130685075 [Manis pentadactyla]